MVEAVHQFEVHLFGRQFTVVTDHRALTNLFSSTVLNTKLWRWALYLQQFDIVFCYQPGKFNTVADCLSRQTWPSPDSEVEVQTAAMQDDIHPRRADDDARVETEGSPLPEAVHESGRMYSSTDLPEALLLSQRGGDVGGSTQHRSPPT